MLPQPTTPTFVLDILSPSRYVYAIQPGYSSFFISIIPPKRVDPSWSGGSALSGTPFDQQLGICTGPYTCCQVCLSQVPIIGLVGDDQERVTGLWRTKRVIVASANSSQHSLERIMSFNRHHVPSPVEASGGTVQNLHCSAPSEVIKEPLERRVGSPSVASCPAII